MVLLPSLCEGVSVYRIRSILTVRWTWMGGRTAEPLTTCSRLSTVQQANSASKNKQLNFCWNKNGRVWNSSLPSDIESLIFINGSWNSSCLPLHCGEKKNVTWSRQCHMQVRRRTDEAYWPARYPPAWNPQHPGCLCGLSFTLGTNLMLLATVHSGKCSELSENNSAVWHHVGKLFNLKISDWFVWVHVEVREILKKKLKYKTLNKCSQQNTLV